MMKTKRYFSKAKYIGFIWSCSFIILVDVLIALSIGLQHISNDFMKIGMPVLQTADEIIIIVGIFVTAISLYDNCKDFNTRNLTYYASLLAIIACPFIIVIGIISFFLIYKFGIAWNAINIIWVAAIMISLIMMIVAFYKANANKQVDLLWNCYHDFNAINNRYQQVNINHQRMTIYNKNLLTPTHFNNLIIFCSTILISAIFLITVYFYMYFNKGFLQFNNQNELIINDKFNTFIALTIIVAFSYLFCLIASGVYIIIIYNKIKLLDLSNHNNFIKSLLLTWIAALISGLVMIIIAIVVASTNVIHEKANIDKLNITSFVFTIITFSCLIADFAISIIAKNKAYVFNYFNLSQKNATEYGWTNPIRWYY